MSEPIEAHEEYPELFQLLAGYFNQDWFDDYPNEGAALADYVTTTPDEDRRKALSELMRLRASCTSEPALAKAMASLSSAYAPRDSPTPIGDFADRIAAAISASLDQPPG